MNFSMTGQEKVTLKYRRLLNRGDCMSRFDCISIFSYDKADVDGTENVTLVDFC